jgi:hypothetical protein
MDFRFTCPLGKRPLICRSSTPASNVYYSHRPFISCQLRLKECPQGAPRRSTPKQRTSASLILLFIGQRKEMINSHKVRSLTSLCASLHSHVIHRNNLGVFAAECILQVLLLQIFYAMDICFPSRNNAQLGANLPSSISRVMIMSCRAEFSSLPRDPVRKLGVCMYWQNKNKSGFYRCALKLFVGRCSYFTYNLLSVQLYRLLNVFPGTGHLELDVDARGSVPRAILPTSERPQVRIPLFGLQDLLPTPGLD